MHRNFNLQHVIGTGKNNSLLLGILQITRHPWQWSSFIRWNIKCFHHGSIAAGETQWGGYPEELAGYLELEPALLTFSAPLVLWYSLHDAQQGPSAATVTRAGLSGKPQAINSLLSSIQVEQVCDFCVCWFVCFLNSNLRGDVQENLAASARAPHRASIFCPSGLPGLFGFFLEVINPQFVALQNKVLGPAALTRNHGKLCNWNRSKGLKFTNKKKKRELWAFFLFCCASECL